MRREAVSPDSRFVKTRMPEDVIFYGGAMEEKTQTEKLAAAVIRIPREKLDQQVWLDPRAMRVCCGHAIEPYLGEIRDSLGPSLYVSVWRCPRCGQVTF